MSSDSFSREDLKLLIIDTLQLEGFVPNMIEDDQPLFGEGLGLDSVDALELVVALEKRFGVKIRSEEMDPKTFATVSTIHCFVGEQMARARGT